MREIISGKDIGTLIDFRTVGPYQARHPWPEETIVSAGKGLVFRRNPQEGEPSSYQTLFMEVYPPGAAFIRGEGETPVSCEDNAWAQYQKALHCPGGTHDWEPRNYHNGAGFCKHCNTFKSQAFTGEELQQFCKICDTPTTDHWGTGTDGEPEFLCSAHVESELISRDPTQMGSLASLYKIRRWVDDED